VRFSGKIRFHERYLTQGNARLSVLPRIRTKVEKETPQFVQLGEVKEMRTEPDIQFRINQGVNKQREQTKIFKLENTGEKTEVKLLSGLHIVRF